MEGYTKDSTGSCTINTDELPCPAGYSNIPEGGCGACPPGCTSCVADQCTSCAAGTNWVKVAENAVDLCRYNCSTYTCGTDATEVCGLTDTATANMVVACNAGYEYDGVSFNCVRTDPSKACPSPDGDANIYYWDDVERSCQTCEPSNGCA